MQAALVGMMLKAKPRA